MFFQGEVFYHWHHSESLVHGDDKQKTEDKLVGLIFVLGFSKDNEHPHCPQGGGEEETTPLLHPALSVPLPKVTGHRSRASMGPSGATGTVGTRPSPCGLPWEPPSTRAQSPFRGHIPNNLPAPKSQPWVYFCGNPKPGQVGFSCRCPQML